MDGLQLIRLLDVKAVKKIQNALGVSPRSIVVTGENFVAVDSVLINGTRSPFFVAYSTAQLVAQVPTEIEDSVITDVAVLSAVPTYTGKSLVELTLGSSIRKVNGPQRLLQNFIRLLLRSPGSNIFHPASGGGLPKRVGKNITEGLAADIAIAISTTTRYIIAAQVTERGIPPEERLLSAEIAGLNADANNATIYITLIITSHAGARSAATLVA